MSFITSSLYEESEVLRIAAAVEKTASHPIAKAIIDKAESLDFTIPVTRRQLVEPGFGTLAEVEGRLVAVGTLEWVNERFEGRICPSHLMTLQLDIEDEISNDTFADYSKSVVYIGREGEGIIGAISVSDRLRVDAEHSVARYEFCLHGRTDNDSDVVFKLSAWRMRLVYHRTILDVFISTMLPSISSPFL